MTALVFSLTLGFVMFLNIVARIPFNADMHWTTKTKGMHNLLLGRMNIPMADFERFIQQNEHLYESFGAVTNPLYNMK